jgi:hypothetical protein
MLSSLKHSTKSTHAPKVPPKGPGIPAKKNFDPNTVAKWQRHSGRDANPYLSTSYFRGVLCQAWPELGKVAKTLPFFSRFGFRSFSFRRMPGVGPP